MKGEILLHQLNQWYLTYSYLTIFYKVMTKTCNLYNSLHFSSWFNPFVRRVIYSITNISRKSLIEGKIISFEITLTFTVIIITTFCNKKINQVYLETNLYSQFNSKIFHLYFLNKITPNSLIEILASVKRVFLYYSKI